MKALLASKPVLWFLFLFNLLVASLAGVALDGSQRILTTAGMGAVSLGAAAALLRGRTRRG